MKRLLLLLLMCAPAWAKNNFLTDTNCVALWKMENGALTIDTIGGNPLQARGSPTAITGDKQEGDASVELNSAGSDELYSTDGVLDNDFPLKYTGGTGGTTISVCAWLKMDSEAGSGDEHVILSKWWTVAGGRSWLLSMYDNGTQSFFMMRKAYNGGNSSEYGFNAEIPYVTGTWYHVGAVYEDSSKNWKIRVYDPNGSNYETSGTMAQNISLTTTEWVIGHEDGAQYHNFDGHIDEVVVFKDVLTSDEIDLIRQGLYGAPAATGTSNWWWRRRHNN